MNTRPNNFEDNDANEQPLGYPSLGGMLTGNVGFDFDPSGHAVLHQDVVGTFKLSDFEQPNASGNPVQNPIFPQDQMVATHPSAPSMSDLLKSNELNPEGADMISNVFSRTITEIETFLTNEGEDDAESVELRKAVARLKNLSGSIGTLLAAIPASAFAGMWDRQFYEKKDTVNIPGPNIKEHAASDGGHSYWTAGLLPILPVAINHGMNIIDRKGKSDDIAREILRLALTATIFIALYLAKDSISAPITAAAANEICGVIAKYGDTWSIGPFRDPAKRYPLTCIVQYVATLVAGLLN